MLTDAEAKIVGWPRRRLTVTPPRRWHAQTAARNAQRVTKGAAISAAGRSSGAAATHHCLLFIHTLDGVAFGWMPRRRCQFGQVRSRQGHLPSTESWNRRDSLESAHHGSVSSHPIEGSTRLPATHTDFEFDAGRDQGSLRDRHWQWR